MLCPQPMSISITAVALLNDHINFTEISQHLVKQSRVYKIQAENGQGQNKQLYNIDLLFCFVFMEKEMSLERRFHFPMKKFSVSSDGDKRNKALQKPIEWNRNRTSPEAKPVFYLASTVGQKITEDFKFCLKFPSFSSHEKREGCCGGAARTVGKVTC